jgi:squalene-associated FAD-dependent desaturase
LDCVIDNGNHLLMSGNAAAMAYLREIGASDRLSGPTNTAFPFVDVTTAARWCLRPGDGPIPWWIFDSARRVPGTHALEYFSALKLLNANDGVTVADCVGINGPLYRNFWEPLTVAALNTDPSQAAAVLMGPVLRETFLKGGAACRPLIARDSLAETLIDPAIERLTHAGVAIRLGTRVRGVTFGNKSIIALDVDGAVVPIEADDTVILAVPPWIAETLVSDLRVPPPGEPIVNVHYRLPEPAAGSEPRIVGVIGGLAQWVFARGDLASVTISAAAAVVDETPENIARRCWPDVVAALDLGTQAEPPSRVVKEKRATFAQTPAALALRPPACTSHANLLLAGDWTATGLPATIEGAVRSGFTAASHVHASTAARAA